MLTAQTDSTKSVSINEKIKGKLSMCLRIMNQANGSNMKAVPKSSQRRRCCALLIKIRAEIKAINNHGNTCVGSLLYRDFSAGAPAQHSKAMQMLATITVIKNSSSTVQWAVIMVVSQVVPMGGFLLAMRSTINASLGTMGKRNNITGMRLVMAALLLAVSAATV